MPLAGRSATRWICARTLLIALLLFSAAAFAAEPAAGPAAVGEVVSMEGAATAQRPGVAPRFLQKGEPLFEGETINTGGGYAIIAFKDGTRFTLRPNTAFAVDTYQHGGEKESAIFRLIKGGMRAVTGAISKRDPAALRVNTTTATIGVRGTSFDTRICTNDCAEEEGAARRKPAAAQPDFTVARVAQLRGTGRVLGTTGDERPLAEGMGLVSGETVRTDKASHAVLAFRDESKVTVIADSEFKLEDVRFRGKQAESGSFVVRIVRGGIRAVTGLLAKSNPKAVNFNVTTATIGVRGTRLDSFICEQCITGLPAGSGAGLIMRDGEGFIQIGAQVLNLGPGQSAVALADILQLAPDLTFPQPQTPLPETVPFDFSDFRLVELEHPAAGLHVGVTNGAVIVTAKLNFVLLSGNDAAVVLEGQDRVQRVTRNWAFEMNRALPDPGSLTPTTKPTIFRSGNVICEIN